VEDDRVADRVLQSVADIDQCIQYVRQLILHMTTPEDRD